MSRTYVRGSLLGPFPGRHGIGIPFTQRSFDDMGTPLYEVGFCVLDLETTGGSPKDCAITEIGAVNYLGGEAVGSFQTLVNPGLAIPPFITILTGISHSMVIEAPPITEALPQFLEFIGNRVIAGHNVRFDLSFLNAATDALGYGRLTNRVVDTCSLARRLVRDEVRNLKLATLAAYFRSPTKPNHRALEDAKATGHVLHSLLERVGTMGVTALGDLLTLPTAKGSPHYRKIELADELPRRPGVYMFKDRSGSTFYVGKAKNLRTRVRSYFYGDDRRRTQTMLHEMDSIDYRVCATELEASVVELRLIHAHRPRHNRRSKPPKASHWLALTDERFPRLSITRTPKHAALATLGPFRHYRSAVRVWEAIWDASVIRRCIGTPGKRNGTCAFSQLGVAMCPCDGSLSSVDYQPIIDHVRRGITESPSLLLDVLREKVIVMADTERFEEAGWIRDRYQALANAIDRRRSWRTLQSAGRVWAEASDGAACIDHGRLVVAWSRSDTIPLIPEYLAPEFELQVPETVAIAEEAHLIWRWLVGQHTVLIDSTNPLTSPAHPIPALTLAA